MLSERVPANTHCTSPSLQRRGPVFALHHSAAAPLGRSQRQHRLSRRTNVKVRAEGSGAEQKDREFEDRLSRLKSVKGQTSSDASRNKAGSKKSKAEPQTKYDFSDEKLHFESPPHRGDLATNIALGTTLLWLPLTFAAIGRAAFVNYRFTDKRISVITSAPWKSEQLDAAYQEVKDVKTVGRGIGLWGDMVVTLRNNNKIELRSLPKFLELKQYILERRDALTSSSPAAVATRMNATSKSASEKKGFL